MKRSIAWMVVALVGLGGLPSQAAAKSLRSSLIPDGYAGTPVEAALKPLAGTIGSQVANQIPALVANRSRKPQRASRRAS